MPDINSRSKARARTAEGIINGAPPKTGDALQALSDFFYEAAAPISEIPDLGQGVESDEVKRTIVDRANATFKNHDGLREALERAKLSNEADSILAAGVRGADVVSQWISDGTLIGANALKTREDVAASAIISIAEAYNFAPGQ